jgi:hypothetical protein
LLDLKVDGRHDCSARTGFYRSGLTDAEGVESWSRPIRRERTGYRSGNRKLFEKKFGLLPPKLEDVQICANTGNGKELIYFGEVEKLERRLNVTCDLALKTTEKCFGTSPISLDRTLLPYVFFPFWILLAVAIARAGGRPVEADIALAFGLLVLGVLTGPLGRFWLLCQVLAVAATLGVTFALAYTLSANHQFRRSNQG